MHEFGRIIRVLGDRSSVRLEHLVVVQDVGGSNPLGHPTKIELMKNLLNDAELEDAKKLLPDWEVSGEFLFRVFLFKNFVEAFDFMTAISSTAEEINHHPDWANVYNKVEVRLSTHDSGGVTSLDVQLASIMDSLFTED